MKNSVKTFAIFVMIMLTLAGCPEEKKFEIETRADVKSYQVIDKPLLDEKIIAKDNFILYIYNPSCGSCIDFKPELEHVIKTNFLIIYAITESDLPVNNDIVPYDTTPTIALFKKGKVSKKIDSRDNRSIFANSINLLEFINKYTTHSMPSAQIELSIKQLDEMISSKKSFIVYFKRVTCSDCITFNTKYLDEYDKINYSKYYYSIDLDPFRSDMEHYNQLKDRYGLSVAGNEAFGYLTGVVPTFQYYSSGILTSAAVVYNDGFENTKDAEDRIIAKKVTSSYYSDAPYIGQTYHATADLSASDVYKNETLPFFKGKVQSLFTLLYPA